MKDKINEHDMTKKMMEIMRGGHKEVLEEGRLTNLAAGIGMKAQAQTQQQQTTQVQAQQPNPEVEGLAKSPNEGRESLIQLDGSYFEMDKNDQRFKAFVTSLEGIVPTATVTSIYISKYGGFVVNGYALKYSENSGLFFTMSLAEDSILVSSENVQGKIGTEVQGALQKFLDKLRVDAIGTRQYQYDEKIDKNNSNENE
tara:strand:- start:29142 stop:29738 length:597 start_codon:yes stop_codon:yes gene_type:complete